MSSPSETSVQKESAPAPAPATPAARKGPGWIMTGIGSLIVFAIFVLVNVFAAMGYGRIDMTANKVHTLTQGTKNILGRVDTNTTIRFFIAPKDRLSPQAQPLVDQTDTWLARFRELNPDKLTVEKISVEPETEEFDQAIAAGLRPTEQGIFFGITVSCLEKTARIQWVPEALSTDGKEDDRIEYHLAKAISEVTAAKKKKVGLMTALTMELGPETQFSFVKELQVTYDVSKVPVTADKIDDTLDVLVLVHPAGITDEAQFAVEQYLLKGGRVVALLDSNSLAAARMSPPNPMGGGGAETTSSLSKLLNTWGYDYDTTKIVADPAFGLPIAENVVQPIILQFGGDAINDKSNELTKNLTVFSAFYSGAFTGSPAKGLSETIYLTTSPNHVMVKNDYGVDPYDRRNGRLFSEKTQAVIKAVAEIRTREEEKAEAEAKKTGNPKPEPRPRILALRLDGKFTTAFPNGKPAPPPPKPQGGPGGFPGGGGFPPGLFSPGGDQGAQGPEGPPALPANPSAAPAPAQPTPTPPAPPSPAPAPATPTPAAPTPTAPAPGTPAPGGPTPAASAPAAPTPAAPTPAAATPTAPTPAAPTPSAPAPGAPAPGPATPAPANPAASAPVPLAPPPPPKSGPVTATTPPISIDPLNLTPAPAAPGTATPLPSTPAPPTGEKPLIPAAVEAAPVLKESVKDGVVYLVGDSDMIADFDVTQNSHNMALILGMVDQASGDRDLMEVRARGAAMRPFTALKEIKDRADERIRKKTEEIDKEIGDLEKEVNDQKTLAARNRTLQKNWMAAMDKQQEKRKQKNELKKAANKEYKDAIFAIKWKNVFLPPLIVALAGIAVFIIRKVRTAAH